MGWIRADIPEELHNFIRMKRIKEGKEGKPKAQEQVITEMLQYAKEEEGE